jgi:hypothetical protein
VTTGHKELGGTFICISQEEGNTIKAGGKRGKIRNEMKMFCEEEFGWAVLISSEDGWYYFKRS